MSNTIKNGKVVYVEPNIASDFTAYNSSNLGTVYKSVNLEDMCIVVGLEVEVKGRTYRSSANGSQNNIELNWQSSTSGEKVSFMEGTKIPTSDGGFVRSLTTNYTDCHLFDIENDGTAEMFGIKSIDISYNNFMVPEVTIQFIDVRGVSVFAQEEMRHNLTSPDGMTGQANNSIEGSFFKCFFTFPYPKFTLKVKGFYGEMVSYELTCSDFRAAFDSNTGNFNVTAKFVGYAFSFLSDVMVNGLVSAPYSEYIGKKYWEDNIQNNRFLLENRNGSLVPMEKLGYICKMYKEIQQTVAEKIKTDGWQNIIDDDKEKKVVQSSDLGPLRATYQDLTNKLSEIAESINSNQDKQKVGDIAINPEGTKSYAFITDYDEDALDELIDRFKAFANDVNDKAKNFEVLDNWLKADGHYIGLDKYDDYDDIIDDSHAVKSDKVKEEKLRNKIQETSANKPINCNEDNYYEAWTDGDDITVYVYQDFGLNQLLSEEVNVESDNEKEATEIKEKYETKLLNEEFGKVFGFEPTVENVTKIIMAHVETFIHMISQCSNNIIGSGTKRSAGSLGIKYEQFPDIATNSSIGATKDTIVAPFPKVTKTNEENGVKKTEGEWIGNILTQDQAEEIKLIDGILNGIAEAANDINKARMSPNVQFDETARGAIRYPLTYFDLFLEQGDKPFGSINLSDVNSIFASMCVRAFSVMVTQGDTGLASNIYGTLDAENFLDAYNGENLDVISNMINSITVDKVWKYITTGNDKIDSSKKNNPWYNYTTLIYNSSGDKYNLSVGHLGGMYSVFPTKNWSFKKLSEDTRQNTQNPTQGLKTKNLENYLISTITDWYGEDNNSPLIFFKEASAVYFKNTYSQIENSIYERESKAASKIFLEANGFVLDSTKIETTPYVGYFYNKAGGFVEDWKSIIPYDAAGNVSSNGEYALSFRDVFMDENFLSLSTEEQAVEFLNRVFLLPSTSRNKVNNGQWTKFCKTKPNFKYLYKFSILRDAVYFRETKDTVNIRSTIKHAYKKYLNDWIKNFYPKIVANYKLQLAPGTDMKKLKKALWDTDHTERAILDVFKEKLEPSYWTKFNRTYKVKPLSQNTNGGVQLNTIPSSEMDSVLRDLIQVVGVCTTSKFNWGGDSYYIDNTLSKSQIEGYFDGFIKTLQKSLVSSTNQTTSESSVGVNGDPDDIKVGVYNYIKMLYDKWLASNTQDNFYKVESLFNGANPTFHFLDSAYNRIGKSIYLNLTTLIDRIVQSQTQNGYTLLSMLSGLYADNKFLFLCIQNFLDLGREDMMEKMFRPIPYLECEEPSNHPNFIVLMPYEPSTRLDVDGADYPDDGFYLNDERTWPEMIKSKPDDSHPIPSFGVCYGQQYQNYFKNIQVDMNSPMTTEQSIKAKFMIAGAYSNNDNNGPKMITMGQDLYTIYSNNSYTCTVTMMGCAWVQPMMYFVLQNVPMFRGSYMIVKVNHQIQPGNMITTFKGVRMANTATRSVKQFIYGNTTDSIGNAGGGGGGNGSINRSSYANIANDCNYAYYSPTGGVVKVQSNADAQAYCYATYQSLVNAGLTDAQAKGICANIKQESGFNPYIVTIDGNGRPESDPRHTHGVGGGLAGFYYHGGAPGLFRYVYGSAGQHKLDELNNKVEPFWKENPKPCSDTNKKKIAEAGIKYDVSFEKQVEYICQLTNTSYSGIRSQTTEKTAAWWWLVNYEKPAESNRVDRWAMNGGWVNSAIETKRTTTPSSNNYGAEQSKSLDEIASGLTTSLESSLRASQYYNQTRVSMKKLPGDMYEYKAISSGTNDTNALFDCLLSSYGNWFDKIEWSVGTTQAKHDALSATIHITKTPPATHNIIITCTDSNGNKTLTISQKEELNESLRLILIKYFKSKNVTTTSAMKSIFRSCNPMSNELVAELFELQETKSIRDCNSVMGQQSGRTASVGNNGRPSGTIDQTIGNDSWSGMKKSSRTINEIIIHCAATHEGQDYTVFDIKKWHVEGRGWQTIGYHYVVYRDGSIHDGRNVDFSGAHCEGHNSHSIGICYVGGLEASGNRPKDTRTQAQKDALLRLLRQMKEYYPNASIHSHKDYANKACPSFDATSEYRNL